MAQEMNPNPTLPLRYRKSCSSRTSAEACRGSRKVRELLEQVWKIQAGHDEVINAWSNLEQCREMARIVVLSEG